MLEVVFWITVVIVSYNLNKEMNRNIFGFYESNKHFDEKI